MKALISLILILIVCCPVVIAEQTLSPQDMKLQEEIRALLQGQRQGTENLKLLILHSLQLKEDGGTVRKMTMTEYLDGFKKIEEILSPPQSPKSLSQLVNLYDETERDKLLDYLKGQEEKEQELRGMITKYCEELRKAIDSEEYWRGLILPTTDPEVGIDYLGNMVKAMHREIECLYALIDIFGDFNTLLRNTAFGLITCSAESHARLVKVLRHLAEQKESRSFVQDAFIATGEEDNSQLIRLLGLK